MRPGLVCGPARAVALTEMDKASGHIYPDETIGFRIPRWPFAYFGDGCVEYFCCYRRGYEVTPSRIHH